MNAREEWRPVVGHPGYEVSNLGNIRSWKRPGGPRPMRLSADNRGYLCVQFHTGRPTTRKVHTVVADAFVGPRPEAMEIRHLDSNNQNNVVGNLAYGTPAENMDDRVALKTHCKQGHPLSGANMYYRPVGRARACRECLRIADRKREPRKRLPRKRAA